MNCLISIIIPTYNRADLIGETLDSIMTQTYANWECIIVDDGSTDNTEEFIEIYLKDPRFQYHKRPANRQKGANACRNYGYELSNGEFVKWFDSDDIMHFDFLQIQITNLFKNSELDFCAAQSLTFYENSDKIEKNLANRNTKSSLMLSYLVKNLYFFTGSPLWRKAFLVEKELFDESLSDSHESDFHFRMLLFVPRFSYLENFLFSIRRRNQSITQNEKNLKSSLESKIVFFKKSITLSERGNIVDKELIIEYLTFRISSTIYQLCTFNSRREILINYRMQIVALLFCNNIKLKRRIELFFGFTLLSFFGKGYNFLKGKLDIREQIVN